MSNKSALKPEVFRSKCIGAINSFRRYYYC